MTIDEAIKELTKYKLPLGVEADTFHKAVRLGIEALERVKMQRIDGGNPLPVYPLPSEKVKE